MALLAAVTVLALRSGVADYWSGVANQELNLPNPSVATQATLWRRAIRARPDVAVYWRNLAQAESAAHPRQSLRDIQHALQLNSQPAESWYDLGLVEFELGNSAAALDALRNAVQDDPQEGRIHFEFAGLARALGQQQLFRAEIRAAAQVMAPNFVGPVLGAAAAGGFTPQEVAALVPRDKPFTHSQGVFYFVNRRNWPMASSLFLSQRRCVHVWHPQWCRAVAADVLNGLTGAARSSHGSQQAAAVSWAQQVWNHALAVGILSGTPATQGEIQDAGFQYPWLGSLFSWRDTHLLPAVIEPAVGPGGFNAVRFDFSGADRQQGSLLEQDLWVQPGLRYAITLASRDLSAPSQGGVSAGLITPAGKPLAQVALPLQPHWVTTQLAVSVPADTSLITLQINYVRPNGETLLQSSVEISAPRMVRAGGQP